ncbi:hypothetical protein ABPG75_012950 [Micractinium tetrahymenae]
MQDYHTLHATVQLASTQFWTISVLDGDRKPIPLQTPAPAHTSHPPLRPPPMRPALALAVLLAIASSAAAFQFHHGHAPKESWKSWRQFKIDESRLNYIDPAPGQFAQKAFLTVLQLTTAKAIKEGDLEAGTKWKTWRLHSGHYKSVVPGTLNGAQYKGIYYISYDVAYDEPGKPGWTWVHVDARSYNKRHFPWAELVEVYWNEL